MRALLPAVFALAGLLTTQLEAQTAPAPPSRSSLDSACVARALPLTGSVLFSGLREAIAEARSWTAPPPLPPAAATVRALKLSLGWSAVLFILGLGVLVFAPNHLRRITSQIERAPLSALLSGLLVDLATIPVLVAVLVLLTITLIGILLIPFAVVAYVLMWIGVAALGFFSVAQVTGLGILGNRRGRMSQRGAALAGLVIGLAVYLLPWVLAAAMTWSYIPAIALRVVAVAITAVAVTTGLGAVIRSHREVAEETSVASAPRAAAEPLAWQTPTPVGGVVAARRTAG